MKILVIKRDKLGDLLLATPMLSHLRASLPDAEIHILVNDYNAWVVDRNSDIDRRWVYRRVRNAGRISILAVFQQIAQDIALRREHFDWVIVANGEESPRAIARGVAIRGRRCVAYCGRQSHHSGITDALPVLQGHHEIDRMLAMLAPLGVPSPIKAPLPHFNLPAQTAVFARDWLDERRLTPRSYVALGLGARRAKKQPSTEQILRWTAHFKNVWNMDTVFMWTPGSSDNALYPGDDEVAQPVLDERLPYIHPYRGPIHEALGLIWNAKSSIFPDSGLMHFAASSPGGVVGLFADTAVSPSPVQWAPRGRRTTYLEATRSVAELPDALVLEKIHSLFD